MSPSTEKKDKMVRKGKKLTKRDIQRFAKILEEEKQRLINDLGQLEQSVLGRAMRDSARDFSAYSNHSADAESDAQERETVLQYASNEGRVLYDILDALRKIEEGEYGICEECEATINKVRLEALPHVRLCLSCQEKADRQRA
ncbi:MAG: hypothetical protein GF355_14690 [Candidatus Eisenbacteria bacterium]|nr:hypothetical protein [Candidatus Eisenbacteria bacterium]